MKITGAELFVKALKEEKVDTLFAYPGGQVIDIFHALYGEKEIEVILPRHEQGLIHAADGYARSTGKVGVCLVTSGPGATNLVTGIATANYDSVPLVCFTGQVPRELMGKDAFQEVDIVSVTGSICKYAVTVQDRESLAATIKKAFHIAQTGKPGVVVVDLPKDIQKMYGSGDYPMEITTQTDFRKEISKNERKEKSGNDGTETISQCSMEDDMDRQIKKALEQLNGARRPVFLIGGGVFVAHACQEMTELAERTGIPVVTTIMGRGVISTRNKLYLGNIGIHGSYAANYAVSNCDVLIAIGTRFNDRITGKAGTFAPDAVIIHIDIDASCISRNIAADIPIISDAGKAIKALLENAKLLHISEWVGEVNRLKKKFPITMKNNGLTPQKIIAAINDMFPAAVIVTDVGQNQLWATQFLELDEHKKLLTSGGLGTMGYGFPAAIGAKIANPNRDVLVVSGDGGMQMNIQEMATAVVYELPIIVCVLNNGYLGNVRQWQEMFYEGKYASTCMRYRRSCPVFCSSPGEDCPEYTPDFVKLAKSYGARGIRITNAGEIEAAFCYAKWNRKTPTVLEFIIDRESNVMPIVPPGNALSDMIL